MSLPLEDEGSFAAGRQALLEALQSLEQRAKDRSEKMVRDAERARQLVGDAELRAKLVTLDAAERLADLEQALIDMRDNLEAARAQLEEQIVSVRGQVEVARATLNTMRERLSTGASGSRQVEPGPVSPPLTSERPPETVSAPTLNDLRAAVDALKKPRRGEHVAEASAEEEEFSPAPATVDEDTNSTHH